MLKATFLLIIAFLTAGVVIYNAEHPPLLSQLSLLNQIKVKGTLNVITREDSSTYYKGANGYTGLEYDLIMLFAEQLQVDVNFIVSPTITHLIDDITKNKAHIAAAGLTVTPERRRKMRFAMA